MIDVILSEAKNLNFCYEIDRFFSRFAPSE